MPKPVFQSKTLITFGAIIAALAASLFFGEDLGSGIDTEAATTGIVTAVAGIVLRFLTTSPVTVKV